MNMEQRVRGGLFGVAIGDALGGTTEFMSRKEISRKHGYLTEIIGGGVWELELGEVTDDTMMTICVAEGILRDYEEPVQAIGDYFLQWYRSNPKDIGNIIRRVLGTYRGDWFEAAAMAHGSLGQSAGNGSLMRCLPVGLSYTKLEDVERIVRLQSRMTHYDERCDEACAIYCRIVIRLLHNESLVEAIKAELVQTRYESVLHAEPACEPSGFVEHTFLWVLYILLHSDSFADAVQQGANIGGDTDTIAAITGGLAGVYYGYDAIPARYSGAILIGGQLKELSRRICDKRADNEAGN
jgi:ADP-ribosyl-[dinitrogen reductase] hydrolase